MEGRATHRRRAAGNDSAGANDDNATLVASAVNFSAFGRGAPTAHVVGGDIGGGEAR